MAPGHPLLSPQQAACPFVFLRGLNHCQGPLFKQIKCSLPLLSVPTSEFPYFPPEPAPRPRWGTPPFPLLPLIHWRFLAHQQTFPGLCGSCSKLKRVPLPGAFLVATVYQGAGGEWPDLVYWLSPGLCWKRTWGLGAGQRTGESRLQGTRVGGLWGGHGGWRERLLLRSLKGWVGRICS